jgi:hypothetical protein
MSAEEGGSGRLCGETFVNKIVLDREHHHREEGVVFTDRFGAQIVDREHHHREEGVIFTDRFGTQIVDREHHHREEGVIFTDRFGAQIVIPHAVGGGRSMLHL